MTSGRRVTHTTGIGQVSIAKFRGRCSISIGPITMPILPGLPPGWALGCTSKEGGRDMSWVARILLLGLVVLGVGALAVLASADNAPAQPSIDEVIRLDGTDAQAAYLADSVVT